MGHQTKPQRAAFRPRVLVKFHDQLTLQHVDGAERGFRGDDRRRWNELAGRHPGLRLRKVFRSVPPRRIQQLVATARERDRSYLPPNFFNYFFLEQPDAAKRAQLVADFAAWTRVERVYEQLEPPPPPDVDYASDPDHALQTHLNDAPDGVGIKPVWSEGGDGTGVTIVDIEKGWGLPHSDLGEVIEIKSGTTADQVHGTRTLGVLRALDNEEGGVGLAPGARIAIAGESEDEETVEREDALMAAIDALAFGDVLLLEMQHGPDPRMPVELDFALWSLMRLATALGIIVVEPAANGGVALDDKLGDDTGAIRVAAAHEPSPTTDLTKKWQRYPTSNYGAGVHCFALGYMVATTEVGEVSVSQSFGQTSAASAIIAGATAALQSWFEQTRGYRIGPLDMRTLLTSHGTPHAVLDQAGAEHPPIGIMPDLAAIISEENALASALLVRDTPTDDGSAPSETYGESPDIIVSGRPVSEALLAAPGVVVPVTLVWGSTIYVYVRVTNRSAVAIPNVVVDLYRAPLGLLIPGEPVHMAKLPESLFPHTFGHVGTIEVGTIDAGKTGVGGTALPAANLHLVAVARTATQPMAQLSAIGGRTQWVRFIQRNPCVASRQIHRVSLENYYRGEMPFHVLKNFGHLHIETDLPERLDLGLELPQALLERIRGLLPPGRIPPDPPLPFPIPLAPKEVLVLGPFKNAEAGLARLAVEARARGRLERAGRLTIRLVHEGRDLSRATLVFEPSEEDRATSGRRRTSVRGSER